MLLLIFFGLFCAVLGEKHINDACNLSSNKPGVCLFLKDCPAAQADIKNKKNPVNCGFEQSQPVVCCDYPVGHRLKQICNSTYSPASNKLDIEVPTEFNGMPVFQIVGGVNSLSKTHSHMAVLGYGEKDNINWACGGTLITEKFVLTAGHCIKSAALNEVKFVRLGDLVLSSSTDDADPQDFAVKRYILHPNYKPPLVYNDIALIELDRPIKSTDYVRPACLHIEREIKKPSFIAVGWGTTSFGGSASDHLQEVKLREFSHADCNRVYESTSRRKLKNGIDDKTQLCAGDANKDTCQGDSGGPLQIRNNFSVGFEVIGVTSFGKSCGIGTTPGVYTRVSHYIEWIESVVFS